MKSLQQQSIIILYDFIRSYDFFMALRQPLLRKIQSKLFTHLAKGLQKHFVGHFLAKKL